MERIVVHGHYQSKMPLLGASCSLWFLDLFTPNNTVVRFKDVNGRANVTGFGEVLKRKYAWPPSVFRCHGMQSSLRSANRDNGSSGGNVTPSWSRSEPAPALPIPRKPPR